MRALKYFSKKQILSLEEALFSSDKNLRYCLIDDAKMTYYISDTINISQVISRLRLSVLKAEYPIMAHFVQEDASTSQMSDWTLAVFPAGFEISAIEAKLTPLGFRRLFKAKRNEVHALENTALYQMYNKRYKTTIYTYSARDLTPREAGVILRARLRTQCKYMEETGLSLHPRFAPYYMSCAKTIIHGAPQELEIVSSELPEGLTHGQIMEIVKVKNDTHFEAATSKI